MPAGNKMNATTLTTNTIFIITIIITLVNLPGAKSCPAPCQCHVTEQTSHVTCANQSLTSIPDGLPGNVTWLDLSGNQISSLTDVFHTFTQLQTLDLSFNKITTFNFTDLSSNSNLQALDLSYNNISSITGTNITDIPNVQVLNLSYNSLSSVDGAIFSGLTSLRELNLSRNSITKILSDTFHRTNGLEVLDLSGNTIREIPTALFSPLASLTTVVLRENRIREFDTSSIFGNEAGNSLMHLDMSYNDLTNLSLNTVPDLKTLNVGWNLIEYLNKTMFKQLENLTSLVLDGNPMSAIHSEVFASLTTLKTMSISFMSNLTYLSKNAFQGLDNIEILELHNNPRLSFIHKELFTNLPSINSVVLSYNNMSSLFNGTFSLTDGVLQKLDVQGNRFICDCAIEWLIEELMSNLSVIQHQDKLQCFSRALNQTVPMLGFDVEQLHCTEVSIVNHTSDSAFRIGSSAILTCRAESDPSPEITWITPRKHILNYHDYYHSELEYIPLSDTLAHLNSSQTLDKTTYYPENESRPDRIRILKDGTLYIDFVMRGDAGPYKCIAKNPRNSTEVVIEVSLDYSAMTDIQIWSLIIGFSSAGSFFLLNLIYSLTLAAIRRCISQRRRERIRHMIETMDHYKTSQLSRIKENYNHQVGRIRDQYHYQLGRLRESHQNQMSRMGRMREGASQRVDKLKENYNNQLGRLKEYSSSQLVQLREKYNSQVDKIKDYGNIKLERLHEKYKLKQQHVIRLLDMMNLDKCRTVFESECVRTESMILKSDVFNAEVPLHSPIDSVSVSDSEYMTATSTESSKYSSQRNINQALDDDSDNDLSPMNPFIPEDSTAVDIDSTEASEIGETSFMTVSETLDPEFVIQDAQLSIENSGLPDETYSPKKHVHRRSKHKHSCKSKRRHAEKEAKTREETEQLYADTCDIDPDSESGASGIDKTKLKSEHALSLGLEEPIVKRKQPRNTHSKNKNKTKVTSKDRPLSIRKAKCDTSKSPNSDIADQLDLSVATCSNFIPALNGDIDNGDVSKDRLMESIV